ncbi:ABC transporter ATP-binding protein [Nocardioides nanhaiensis]|uniref:ABC transporter ATP-binding protein n=1 Tax=Nocardioides nanhaiensis TaxID=1476871 RepID=A0ABP8VWL8_9ACTN
MTASARGSAVEVRGLGFGYGRTPVLDGLDLSLNEGGLLAVVGRSGCGKTTLLRLLAGFERPQAGRVLIGGLEVAGGSTFVPTERRRVGIVPQEGALFPHLTVAGNVEFGLTGATRLPRADREARVRHLLELVGLPDLPDRYPRELSGGQQQRVALARALAPRPALVLLDEPFASLDQATRSTLRGAVRDVLRSEGAAALLVTHDHEEALSMADRVACLDSGRVVQEGSPHEVYDEPVDPAVAALLGEASWLPGSVTARGDTVSTALGDLVLARAGVGGRVRVLLRPEQVELGEAGTDAVVQQAEFLGASTRLVLRLPDGATVRAAVPGARVRPGDRVRVVVRGAVHALAGDVEPSARTPA